MISPEINNQKSPEKLINRPKRNQKVEVQQQSPSNKKVQRQFSNM